MYDYYTLNPRLTASPGAPRLGGLVARINNSLERRKRPLEGANGDNRVLLIHTELQD